MITRPTPLRRCPTPPRVHFPSLQGRPAKIEEFKDTKHPACGFLHVAREAARRLFCRGGRGAPVATWIGRPTRTWLEGQSWGAVRGGLPNRVFLALARGDGWPSTSTAAEGEFLLRRLRAGGPAGCRSSWVPRTSTTTMTRPWSTLDRHRLLTAPTRTWTWGTPGQPRRAHHALRALRG